MANERDRHGPNGYALLGSLRDFTGRGFLPIEREVGQRGGVGHPLRVLILLTHGRIGWLVSAFERRRSM